jgi:hypothetical protein
MRWGMICVEGDCKIVGTPWILGTALVGNLGL